MSWATPSCISRASRRRSSAVAASRNAGEEQGGVEVHGGRARGGWPGSSGWRGRPSASGSSPGERTPATTATVPAPLLSGRAKRVVGDQDRLAAERAVGQVLGCRPARRWPRVVVDDGGQLLAARDVHDQPANGQLVVHGAGDQRGQGDGLQARVRLAGECRSARGSGPGRCGRSPAGRAARGQVAWMKVPIRPRPEAGDRPGERCSCRRAGMPAVTVHGDDHEGRRAR